MLRRDFVKSIGSLAVLPWLPSSAIPDESRKLPQFSEMLECLRNAPQIIKADFQTRLAKLRESIGALGLSRLFLEPIRA